MDKLILTDAQRHVLYTLWAEAWVEQRPGHAPPTEEQFYIICAMMDINPVALFGGGLHGTPV